MYFSAVSCQTSDRFKLLTTMGANNLFSALHIIMNIDLSSKVKDPVGCKPTYRTVFFFLVC